VSIKEKLGKIDRVVFAKALGIIMLGWLALPIIYFILLRRKRENEKETETLPCEGGEDILPKE